MTLREAWEKLRIQILEENQKEELALVDAAIDRQIRMEVSVAIAKKISEVRAEKARRP